MLTVVADMRKPILLITANVGSLFEDTTNLRKNWLTKIVQTIRTADPIFVALHLQEIGGKHFQLHSREVPNVINELYDLLQPDYTSCLALLDLDFNVVEEYTALGSVFFIHQSAFHSIQLYRFGKSKFKRIKQNALQIKQDLRNCKKIRKEKFPRELWPVITWGRKGYLHTRWSINGIYLDLINLHLFHDDSNLLTFQNPSLYSANRKKAMEFVLEKYSSNCSDKSEKPALLFIFGDFNFRLNASSFLKKITSKTTQFNVENGTGEESPGCSADDSDPSLRSNPNSYSHLNHADHLTRQLSAIEFRRPEEQDEQSYVLRIEKKRFDFCEPTHFTTNWQSFRADDQEPGAFSLNEARINFPPTYPWSEDPVEFNSFMNTRAPAWCDRILMNTEAWHYVSKDAKHVYNSIGKSACMGDHKPVYLTFSLASKSS
ncbi:Inositol-polyphosphate 5-phosphatase [Aphelenchoides bicaudatus]|nr:Inositol-polyphosphate 5-phosphatase [Aphelenchoides bicaudatus]